MDYNDWISQTLAAYNRFKDSQRLGQFLFNSLTQVKPALAQSLVNTEFDPFYDEDQVRVFMQEVARRW